MDSKILLTNFPRIHQRLQFQEESTNAIMDVTVGYDGLEIDTKTITKQIANDIITALITYDSIYIEAYRITDLIQVFGYKYLQELLRLKLIKIIPDQHLNPAIKKIDANWEIGFFAYPQGNIEVGGRPPSTFKPHKWSHIENFFSTKGFTGLDANATLYLIDENSIDIDESLIENRTNQETKLDLKNSTLQDHLNLNSQDFSQPVGADFQKLLRLQELNKTGILASSLDIQSIKVDAEINSLLAMKSLSEFSKIYTNGIDALQQINYEKGFPDFGELFTNDIIGLEEILRLRESFQGKKFRSWIHDSQYDERLIRQEIMSTAHNVLGGSKAKLLRMLTVSIIGIAGLVPGIVASVIDSFIVSNIAKGWHPNFFLDKKLKDMIDKSISNAEQKQKREYAQKMFKGVGRNDLCPCGSNLKFKKCHGK